MTGLVISPPLPAMGSVLSATDVPETDYAAWVATTLYALGDRCISTTTHKVYESMAGGATADVAISNGSGLMPGVVSWAGHGQAAGMPVKFASNGALPAPLVAGTVYYVANPTAGTFDVAATSGGAPINTTSAGSGIHTASASFNYGFDPTVAANIGTQWLEVSATNRFKCLDGSNSTQTAQATGMYYEVTMVAQQVTTFYAGNVADCTSIRLRMTDPTAGLVYNTTTSMVGKSSLVTTGLPNYPNAVVRVDLASGGGLAVGTLQLGLGVEFGSGIDLGARVGIQDYSRKQTDEFGNTILVERAYSKRASFTLRLTVAEIDALQDFLAAHRATPCLFIAYGPLGALTIWGFFKSFEILINYAKYADCSFDVEGLT